MIKKIIITTLMMFIFSLPSVNAQRSELKLFDNILIPSNPDLQETYKKIKGIDNNLEKIIKELKDEAQNINATQEQKTDYAAFLLKKVLLQKNLPYEKNEGYLLELSDLIPGDFYLENIWGDLLLIIKDFENSINHYESALNKKPEDDQTIGKCGLAHYGVLHYEKALEYFQIYLAKNPNDFVILSYAGMCASELTNYDEAIELWEKALEIAPNEMAKKEIEKLIRKAKERLASTSDSTQEEDQRFVISFAGNSREDLGDITFDMLNEIYYDVTNLLNCNPDVRFNVIFYLTDDYYKEGQSWSAAAASGLKIMIPLKTGYKDENYVKGTLAHEFTHTIINLKTNNRAPLWVHEGLAQYQEYSTSYGSPDVIRSDFESTLQNDFIDKGLFIPLNRISSYIGSKDRKDIVRGYVASYMAIRCMADLYGEQSFDSLLSAIGKGKNIQDAINETTGKDYDEFQDELKQWMKNQ